MKLKQLIKDLKRIEKELAADPTVTNKNPEVYLSGDSEGNYFGTIDKGSFGWDPTQQNLTLYPCEEFVG